MSIESVPIVVFTAAQAQALMMCLEACRIALECEKDCDNECDEYGEDFFHVKCLKQAIAAAKKADLLEAR